MAADDARTMDMGATVIVMHYHNHEKRKRMDIDYLRMLFAVKFGEFDKRSHNSESCRP